MASPAPLLLLRVKRKATETPVEAIEVTGAGGAKRRKTATAVFRPDILFLKHESSIFRQSSNLVCGSWKSQASSPWAKQHRV